MKKLILGLLAVLLITTAYAQDGKKALKEANKAFGAYNIDPTGNKAKLTEAVEQIDLARPALHTQVNDGFRLRREMRLLRQQIVLPPGTGQVRFL